MRMDLLPHGVKVSSIAPGMVETEFSLVRFKGNQERAARVYEHMTPLSAADVADACGMW
jgi:NADP-dependent 3-hydroxy acid dehydrogenase YdfG